MPWIRGALDPRCPGSAVPCTQHVRRSLAPFDVDRNRGRRSPGHVCCRQFHSTRRAGSTARVVLRPVRGRNARCTCWAPKRRATQWSRDASSDTPGVSSPVNPLASSTQKQRGGFKAVFTVNTSCVTSLWKSTEPTGPSSRVSSA